ncbi:threonine--tRNA ligase [Patescibacteria group bacterium]|nr:threonine--tRNA ligase [Patescibacteria group bacterium]
MPKEDKLQSLRHSAEHILTQAMLRLFPGIKMAMGPAIENGFYFDFDPGSHKVSEEDFPKIEAEMQKIIDADLSFTREEISFDKARELFENNPYKQEWLDEIRQKGDEPTVYWTGSASSPQAGKISQTQTCSTCPFSCPARPEPACGEPARGEPVQPIEPACPELAEGVEGTCPEPVEGICGEPVEPFVDLCTGPHVNSTGEIKAFKLLSVAGAYWRGDEKNKMLTRIYGTAFPSQKELAEYLKLQEEAKKRDHRVLGKQLGLYGIYPEIGAGLPVWLPNGYRIRRTLEDYMLKLERSYGYEHILTPHIGKDTLFATSGHLDFYKDSMYAPVEIDDEVYYLKPMNCPMGIIVYNSQPHSYRELPLKLGEFGTVYRYEKSGVLSGLARVRGFTQNDAHIICTPDQLMDQFLEVFEMLQKFYQDLGFANYTYRLGLGDPKKEKFKFCGTSKDWQHAESTIKKALDQAGVEYYEEMGEAAFYGPKLDVQALDPLGREESVSTIQIDFNLPGKFGMTYIDDHGEKQQPFVIHRALIGSFERFFAFLIEFYAGNFPVWLSPLQVKIIPISEEQNDYAREIKNKLQDEDIRVEINSRNETMQAKIRDAQNQKVPYMLVVGKKEQESGTVNVRLRTEKKVGEITVNKFLERIKSTIEAKSLDL